MARVTSKCQILPLFCLESSWGNICIVFLHLFLLPHLFIVCWEYPARVHLHVLPCRGRRIWSTVLVNVSYWIIELCCESHSSSVTSLSWRWEETEEPGGNPCGYRKYMWNSKQTGIRAQEREKSGTLELWGNTTCCPKCHFVSTQKLCAWLKPWLDELS